MSNRRRLGTSRRRERLTASAGRLRNSGRSNSFTNRRPNAVMYATSNRRLSKYRLVETHVRAPVNVMTGSTAHQSMRQSIAGGCGASPRDVSTKEVAAARYTDGTEKPRMRSVATHTCQPT